MRGFLVTKIGYCDFLSSLAMRIGVMFLVRKELILHFECVLLLCIVMVTFSQKKNQQADEGRTKGGGTKNRRTNNLEEKKIVEVLISHSMVDWTGVFFFRCTS